MSLALVNELKSSIRSIPDFPKPGILFRDITTLLKEPLLFKKAIDDLAGRFKEKKISKVAGIESRGFLMAAPLAYLLGAGFVPVRKKGKLPSKTISVSYALEYGTDSLEIHTDAFSAGDRVLIADDLLATGGTAAASCALIEKSGADIVGLGFLIELGQLKGRERLGRYNIESLLTF